MLDKYMIKGRKKKYHISFEKSKKKPKNTYCVCSRHGIRRYTLGEPWPSSCPQRRSTVVFRICSTCWRVPWILWCRSRPQPHQSLWLDVLRTASHFCTRCRLRKCTHTNMPIFDITVKAWKCLRHELFVNREEKKSETLVCLQRLFFRYWVSNSWYMY